MLLSRGSVLQNVVVLYLVAVLILPLPHLTFCRTNLVFLQMVLIQWAYHQASFFPFSHFLFIILRKFGGLQTLVTLKTPTMSNEILRDVCSWHHGVHLLAVPIAETYGGHRFRPLKCCKRRSIAYISIFWFS